MLVSKKHKKLLLNLRDPEQVLAIIPGAKTIQIRDQDIVAVPHDQDTVRVLRNLGLAAPGPIRSYYDWPGRFTPFIHQHETSEFFTLNPRAFCLNDMGCIAGDDTVRVSRKGKSYETSLRQLHQDFHRMPDKDSWKARSLKGSQFGMNKLLDVLYKGEKPTLRITLADGKTLRATPDHRMARPDGTWTEAGRLALGDSLVTNGATAYKCPRCGVPRLRATPPRTPEQVCMECKHAAHSEAMKGESNPSWVGGKWVDGDGYVRILVPGHHRADNHGYVYEHIVVAEGLVGYPITQELHVHHKNGHKADNSPGNLEVLPEGEHHRQHAPYAKLDGAVSSRGGTVVVLPKSSEIVSIVDGGTVDVYDLCMEAPHHNFVVNGVVVHNSGKTAAVLWAYDWLRSQGILRKMLVISPLSTLERTWGDEIFGNLAHLKFVVVHGTAARRKLLLESDADIYIINHDGIKDRALLNQLAAKEGLDLVVVDELASFRNASTDRWKALNYLVNGDEKKGRKPMDWVWGLTGTPMPNEPVDVWAQCKLIMPGSVPKFRNSFRDMTMRQLTQFKWVAKPDALDTVFRYMQPSIRFAREDCIDLPPTTFIDREVALSPEQAQLYKQMVAQFKAEYAGGQITAANEAVKIGKLLQIVCGVAYTEGGDMTIPSKARIDEVLDIVEGAGSKVIVFVPLTGALNSVAEQIGRHYPVAVVHGGTSKTQRDNIFSEFKSPHGPRVLVAQPGTMAHGLSLVSANTIVWYAPIHSSEIYQQANARIVRPGQKLNTLIARIQGSEVERRMYAKLEKRGTTQGVLLGMFD